MSSEGISSSFNKVEENCQSVPGKRILAPDLARGFTLLGIAVANVVDSWLPPPAVEGKIVNPNLVEAPAIDKFFVVFNAVFVHIRGLPMFATLLGYGIGLLTLSLTRREYPIKAAKRVLVRRYGVLALFGLVHMFFLYSGDIMFFYGIAGMLLAVMISWSDKRLLKIAAIGLCIFAFFICVFAVGYYMSLFDLPKGVEFGGTAAIPQSWLGYFLQGPTFLLFNLTNLPFELMSTGILIILGFLAARRGILSHPERHKRLLTWLVVVAAIVALVVGTPLGLVRIGMLPEEWAPLLMIMNGSLGLLTGPGIIAAVALASISLQRRLDSGEADGRPFTLPVFIEMIVALGRRSMTGYVLQSMILLPLVAPFLLNVLQYHGVAFSDFVGLSVWLITLCVAYLLEHCGKKGPLEALHRRLSYGKDGLRKKYMA
ncbi:DUF418 domain-containing protein [Corynebacterium freiburgense]|uniref:DUF418 domain-containing protein n=1 Tax=Corynebacterium freiburgense TaxID=556548 RepID=UPI000427F965|nr:DUF418 domain-containing protein [Corynebacterium freiburgense]